MYSQATEYMISKNQVAWPIFEEAMIEEEIMANMQWKLNIDHEIACIWATTFSDEQIWGEKNDDPAVYIHRIASNPAFRGKKLVNHLVEWAKIFAVSNNKKFIRMDTVGLNQGLISHYGKMGFKFLGSKKLNNTEGLPDHYKQGEVCFFELKL